MSIGERRLACRRDQLIAWRTALHLFFLVYLISCQRVSPSEAETRSTANEQSSSSSMLAVQREETNAPTGGQQREVLQKPATPASGKDLYALHCASCHGEQGDGKGIAAPYLFPKPRDFRAGRFRLVSTSNNVPTRDDLLAVLLRGMPGSSMPPWRHLTEAEREALVEEVLRLRAVGARETFVGYLKEEDELTDEEIAEAEIQEEIEEYVRDHTTPGESRGVPAMEASTPDAVGRGKEVYAKFACISCHGETGRGDGVQEMWDDEKLPTSPRDFTLGIFKGSPDPASLFRRIAFGMPGTPMPSSSNMTPDQLEDLIHYIRSLSTDDQRQQAVLKRERIVAKRVSVVPSDDDAQAWSDAPPIALRMVPLWWRNDADPDLQIRAIHDGNTIALRIMWSDDTKDERAMQSESFEDAVAMELYRGGAEPFLGMGSMAHPVDVWFWDADRQSKADIENQYVNTVADVYPFSEKTVETAEYQRPGTSAAAQPEVSLPALASKNSIVPSQAKTGASDLTGGGPGSVTFRIPKNPLVGAEGNWRDGRWTVVMRRPLKVTSPDEGVSLAPGEEASVAFAIWDGSHRDRDGQKRITVWQDLQLEK